MLDGHGREINYLRISVTDRCNLRCSYCMPREGVPWKPKSQILSYEEIARIVSTATGMGITKVRLTGGEPLARRNICGLIRSLGDISGLRELCLTTNGILLKGLARELKEAGLDRLNISLDTLDPDRYRELTHGGDIRRVLAGIDAALAAGFKDTKLNMVLMPGTNGAVERMAAFCREKSLRLQRINHYSLHRKERGAGNGAERPLPCRECNRIRLTADGKLKPCLFSDLEFPVDLEDITSGIERAVRAKPERGKGCTVRGNWEIGG